jgi:decaprenylphospho-beta-D-erythro-pentofuranosid-2-ulose 2-reductase
MSDRKNTADRPQNVILCGATSAVAVALGRRLASRGWRLHLLGRDLRRLEQIAADLSVRGSTEVTFGVLDASNIPAVPAAFAAAVAVMTDPLDGVIVCHGVLPDEAGRLPEPNEIQRTIDVNFTSVAILLSLAAERLAGRSGSFLAAISSVAGDRGRQSNFCYGSAKAALSTWLSGLRNRLQPLGVRVLTVKPGIIASPMTAGLSVGPKALITSPDAVAADIERAILRGRDVIYTPWFWSPIMAVIRALPEQLFKRLKL